MQPPLGTLDQAVLCATDDGRSGRSLPRPCVVAQSGGRGRPRSLELRLVLRRHPRDLHLLLLAHYRHHSPTGKRPYISLQKNLFQLLFASVRRACSQTSLVAL